ncbi:glycoside hydrolase family 55 protein [Glonium stellatum]|uniref:Glycoside hydrolase family 55 protein n=1 Tax=Glonium stellatum TaxID=574774 RepID=A0A8E2ESS3_9PEZI|nr:glycoside hydrolase family 55 protein [Glonium stellatum]
MSGVYMPLFAMSLHLRISSGIPYTIHNISAEPWVHLVEPSSPRVNVFAAEAACPALFPSGSSQYWYEAITHNGQSSFMDSSYKANYKVFRNVVTDFGADNTGTKDASSAIQSAIAAGATNGPNRSSNSMGTTGQPAVVYIPSGIYLMEGSIQLYVGTVIVGDPLNPPVLKASSNFPNDHIVYGKDPNHDGTINFYMAFKNIIIDSTNVSGSTTITLLDWTVSQATQLTNVVFNMPNFSTGHTGLSTTYGYNSNVILNDLTFYGGVVAMSLSGQQWVFKNITIISATTGVIAGGTNLVFIGCTFKNVETGINANGISGSLTVIDSTGSNLGSLITSYDSGNAGNSIILENVANSGNTVTLGSSVVKSGSVIDTWVHGNYYAPGNANAQHEEDLSTTTPRSSVLVSNGNYFTIRPPTYQDYSVSQFINIKSVSAYPVYGDGVTDDTNNINAILSQYASCKIVYFPAGTYIVTNTIVVPAGSRIVGEAYGSAISAVGSNFYNPNAPTTMVQVGNSGDVGVAQISDMLFTVADVLQGCKLVEVNIAGSTPGDVGIWNSHFRIGGAAGSKVETNCAGSPDICKAAWGLLHLTNTSSAYIENMWGWTADHDLDGGNGQTISTGRGMLIEATKGTWLVGTAMEHHTLYQYNFEYASNVFSAMQQSETPYWQGPGNDLAPIPWASNLIASDPTFSNCGASDATCRMAFFERIRGSSNLFLYGGCVWAFFNNGGNCSGDCQQNAIRVLSSQGNIYLYGINVKSVTNLVVSTNTDIATESANAGGWGGVVAAYAYDA